MIHVLGVRHHGPGSARGLRDALAELRPDCVLIEGPPDAQDVLALAAHADMQPPVALLVYAPDEPRRAAFFPFAEFSPEWQALRHASQAGVPARFFDLPQRHQLALSAELVPAPPAEDAQNASADDQTEKSAGQSAGPLNVYAQLAQAAGYAEFEQWWEHVIELRGATLPAFDALREAMAALREPGLSHHTRPFEDPRLEPAREAHMRQMIREAEREGFVRIAVVCGAWHAPALMDLTDVSGDAALLAGLPKIKVSATWAPWTYGRLTFASGYGAGVAAPGWYDHVWRTSGQDARGQTIGWLARGAATLRAEGIEVSSAHIIEAARLAEALAAFRGRRMPDLSDLNEATLALMCDGNPALLTLIQRRMIVGERIGAAPADAPAVPLLQDVQREQRRLRMAVAAEPQQLDLDLRKPNDLDRSRLLHRLMLLNVPWGAFGGSSGKGTFRELWTVRWEPELSVGLIAANVWGNTIVDAATACARARADGVSREAHTSPELGSRPATPASLPELAKLLSAAILADLPDAVSHIMSRLHDRAATDGDVSQLMDALPALADVLRYGNVRRTDTGTVSGVVDGFVTRICIGLPGACASLDDDAAHDMLKRVMAVNGVVTLLQNPQHAEHWHTVLAQLAGRDTLHGLLAGRCARLLHDARVWAQVETAQRLSWALATAADPERAAAWVEGFVAGSAQLLLHDDALWGVIDDWVCGIGSEAFVRIVPLLRRTFGAFSGPERRNLGARAKEPRAREIRAGMAQAATDASFDRARAEAALPLVLQMLGLSPAAVPAREDA